MIKFKKIELSFPDRLARNVKVKKGEMVLQFPEFNEELKEAVRNKFKNTQSYFDEKLKTYSFYQKTKTIVVSLENDLLHIQEFKKSGNLISNKPTKGYLLQIIK